MEFDSKRCRAAYLRAMVICLFMTHAAASDSCLTRVACGEIGISRGDCEMKGCCFDGANDAVEPRCFFRGENLETCESLTLRASCRTYEKVVVEKREISIDAFGYRPDPNIPLTDSGHRGEVIVEVTQTEGSGQLPVEVATASIEEVAPADQGRDEITVEEASVGHGHNPDEIPESLGSVPSEESSEVIVHVIHGEEGIGEHPVAATASLTSLDEFDGFSEELELESYTLTAARPFVPIDESEGLVDLPMIQESGDIDEPDVSFAYGSVGAPASMMELEDLKHSLQTMRPPPIHKTKSEKMQMAVQTKELAEIYRPKSETVCTQSSEGNIERLGWLVLVNADEPIELFTFKKDFSDESSKTQSESAHSVSPLRSPRSHFAQASIKDASTTTTREHLSEFSKSSSGLTDTDPEQAGLDGNTKGKANASDKANHKNDGILTKKSMYLNCAISKLIPCGNGRVTKRECRERGCCWKSLSRNFIQAGCYLPQSEVEANTFHLTQVAV